MQGDHEDAGSTSPPSLARQVFARCGVLIPTVTLFGMAVGVVAAHKGFSTVEATLMSALVFAGASQIVALEAWSSPPAYLTIAVIAAAVNSRYFLIGATLGPFLSPWHALPRFGAFWVTVDPNWAMAMEMPGDRAERARFLVASGLLLYVFWVASTTIGHLLGARVPDAKAFGFDLLLVSYFALLLVGLWKGGRMWAVWGTALAVAVSLWWLVGGYLHIVAGAVAGATVAAFWGDEKGEADAA